MERSRTKYKESGKKKKKSLALLNSPVWPWASLGLGFQRPLAAVRWGILWAMPLIQEFWRWPP